jgi:hypothetical protein
MSILLYKSPIIKPFIIHLVGQTNNVNQAAEEITNFLFNIDQNIPCKIINNNKINIINEYLTNSILINKCHIMSCKEIGHLHNFVNISSMYCYYSFAFLIRKNSLNPNEFDLNKCININEVYNLQDNIYNKRFIINKYL